MRTAFSLIALLVLTSCTDASTPAIKPAAKAAAEPETPQRITAKKRMQEISAQIPGGQWERWKFTTGDGGYFYTYDTVDTDGKRTVTHWSFWTQQDNGKISFSGDEQCSHRMYLKYLSDAKQSGKFVEIERL